MKPKTLLTIMYYVYMTIFAVVVVLFRYANTGDTALWDPMAQDGQMVQYAVIAYMLASVPGALFFFKRAMKNVAAIEDEKLKEQTYTSYAFIRMSVIAFGVVLGILAFYLMGGYMPMLWCAAISAVAMIFCKPTQDKIEAEMNDIN